MTLAVGKQRHNAFRTNASGERKKFASGSQKFCEEQRDNHAARVAAGELEPETAAGGYEVVKDEREK